MNLYQIKKVAEKNGTTLQQEYELRRRHVIKVMFDVASYIAEETDELPEFDWSDAVDELIALRKVMTKGEEKFYGDQITDAMIEEARNFPITELINFTRGKVTCPFHDDKSPSAYHATRSGRLACPVCNKTWDAINYLREKDDMSFPEAVKELCRK